MRTAATILILLALTSCACVSKPRTPVDVSPRNTAHVTVRVDLVLDDVYPRYDVMLRLTNNSDGYSHLVQEIEMEDGWCLVEVFRLAKHAWAYDRHHGTGWRRMRVYPANVVGALEHKGFAHLMRNQAGTMVTKIPAGFNMRYRAACGDGPWPGVITKQSPETAATWRITPDGALRQVEVWTGDGIVFLR